MARLFSIAADAVTLFLTVDAASALKFALRRPQPSGAPGESNVFGSQQYPPLFEIEIP